MSNPAKRYSYGVNLLTAKQIQQRKSDFHHPVSLQFVKKRLQRGMSVEDILRDSPKTKSQCGTIGARYSVWGCKRHKSLYMNNDPNGD